ncbi:MAG: DUF1573 domain-containing protein [Bacteroidota bacterium]
MRVFLFTLFVSIFLGLSLYVAIWYTQTYLGPTDPLASSVEVGHLENLFAEKVSDSQELSYEDEDWDWEGDSTSRDHEEAPITEQEDEEITGPIVEKQKEAPRGIPRGKLNQTTHDFGSIDEGVRIEHTFKLMNRGTGDLRITDFEVGCGCTMVDFPRTPISPGKSIDIKAVFDSKDKLGPQNKMIRLRTNGTPRNLEIFFKGWVYPQNFGKEGDKEGTKETPKDSVKQR